MPCTRPKSGTMSYCSTTDHYRYAGSCLSRLMDHWGANSGNLGIRRSCNCESCIYPLNHEYWTPMGPHHYTYCMYLTVPFMFTTNILPASYPDKAPISSHRATKHRQGMQTINMRRTVSTQTTSLKSWEGKLGRNLRRKVFWCPSPVPLHCTTTVSWSHFSRVFMVVTTLVSCLRRNIPCGQKPTAPLGIRLLPVLCSLYHCTALFCKVCSTAVCAVYSTDLWSLHYFTGQCVILFCEVCSKALCAVCSTVLLRL